MARETGIQEVRPDIVNVLKAMNRRVRPKRVLVPVVKQSRRISKGIKTTVGLSRGERSGAIRRGAALKFP